MPIMYPDIVRGSPRNALSVPVSREEVLRESFAQFYEENPLKAAQRWDELRAAEGEGPILSAESARATLKDAGLERDLMVPDGGITQAALDTLMWRKRIERRRQEVFARAQGGFVEGAERLGIGLLTSLVDPLSMGLNFVPIVGQARYARWLAASKGLGGRLATRAGVGAIEGAAGAALAEPVTYMSRTREQADYDTVDSLMNVTFGGVIGAGLHTSVGSLADLISTRGVASQIPRDEALDARDRATERHYALQLAGNVDRAIEEYSRLEGAEGGKLLNTDLARELSPEYRADRTRSSAVHEPASWLVKKMYERKLAEPPKAGEDAVVAFSAGGTGAGKTTGLDLVVKEHPDFKRAQIIYDTNLNGLASSVKKIEQALKAQKQVVILYTWRDPVDSLVNGALPRAMRMGRTVPLTEHAKTHVGAAQTVKALAERYKDDPRVTLYVVDNSHGKGKQRLGQLAEVPDFEYNRVYGDLAKALEERRQAGAISEAVYRATAPEGNRATNGAGSGGRDAEGRPLTASSRVANADAEIQQAALRAAVGQAVEGRPIDVEPILSGALPRDIQRTLDPEYRHATQAAEEALAKEAPSTLEGALKEAEEGAALAQADLKALSDRLGIKVEEDLEFKELSEKAERWARAAEFATTCLVRGD